MRQTVSPQTCVVCGRADAARYASGPRVEICDDIVVCASCLDFARELTASSGAVQQAREAGGPAVALS